jgi:phospholipid/cholesterol/gamma-HCH transport system permease protein
VLDTARALVRFTLATLAALPGAMVRRPAEVVRQLDRVAWGSWRLITAAGASIGLVTWMQARHILVRYGLEATLPSFLAGHVLVETGPMLASLLVAGRLGAGLAAELSSMTLTEEIDARTILGASTIPSLVAPRVVACTLAVPLLTVWLDATAILSGLAAEIVAGSLSPALFWARSLDFLTLADIIPATLKTALFGLLIGLVGCGTGLTADRSTEAVGHAATRGVVGSMLAVFAANVLLVPLIQLATARSGP